MPSHCHVMLPLMESANYGSTTQQLWNRQRTREMEAAVEVKRFLDLERTYALAVDEKKILNALK